MTGNQSPNPILQAIAPAVSSYQDYLPAVLQADPFLEQFLLAFEGVLSGFSIPRENDPCPGMLQPNAERLVGLEEVVTLAHTYFDCDRTPAEFLPWLSGWVALSLKDNWPVETKRQFIAEIVPLYRQRGTKAALVKILQIYLRSAGFESVSNKAQITEFDDPPHYFQVALTLPDPDPQLYWQQARIARAIIDQEKPAHTFYALKILVPTMQIRGKFYPLTLTEPGTLSAELAADPAENNPASNRLSLKIKAGPSQTEVYAQSTGTLSDRKALSVSHQVTAAQLAENSQWHISVANLSAERAIGVLTIRYPGSATAQVHSLNLGSGLQIGRPPAGNTLLGNSEGSADSPLAAPE